MYNEVHCYDFLMNTLWKRNRKIIFFPFTYKDIWLFFFIIFLPKICEFFPISERIICCKTILLSNILWRRCVSKYLSGPIKPPVEEKWPANPQGPLLLCRVIFRKINAYFYPSISSVGVAFDFLAFLSAIHPILDQRMRRRLNFNNSPKWSTSIPKYSLGHNIYIWYFSDECEISLELSFQVEMHRIYFLIFFLDFVINLKRDTLCLTTMYICLSARALQFVILTFTKKVSWCVY